MDVMKKKMEMSELEELLYRNKSKIINGSLDNSEKEQLIVKVSDAFKNIIYKSLNHFNYLTLHKLHSWVNKDLCEQASDYISYNLINNSCNCGNKKCSEQHNISYWLTTCNSVDLNLFLKKAINREANFKGREKMFHEGMLYDFLKSENNLISYNRIIKNVCSNCKVKYDYSEVKCFNCSRLFDETIMRRKECNYIIINDGYIKIELHKCKACENLFRKSLDYCPLLMCKNRRTNRTTNLFAVAEESLSLDDEDGKIDSKLEKYYKEEYEKEFSFPTEIGKIEEWLKAFNEISVKRPWLLIYILFILHSYQCKTLKLRNLISETTLKSYTRQILENKWEPKVNNIKKIFYEFFNISDKDNIINIQEIKYKLLSLKVELDRQGINTKIKVNDIDLSISKIQKHLGEILAQHINKPEACYASN